MIDRNIRLLPLDERNEKSLVRQLKEGRPEAFELLYRHHVGRVLGLAKQLLSDPGSVEDATQETFIRVFRSIGGFRRDSGLATWIHRIAVNVCLTELDRRKRRPAQAADPLPPEGHGAAEPHFDSAISLTEMLHRLDVDKRLVFYLHHVEGLTASEIADVTGKSRAAVNKCLQRTRTELVEMWRAADRRSSSVNSVRGKP